MDYKKHYELLISTRQKFHDERKTLRTHRKQQNAKNRTFLTYFENHHILPKCLGGTNDNENLILLTAREHYIAHYLLAKIYPDAGLAQAIWKMTYSGNYVNVGSLSYSRERKKYIEKFTGKGSPCYGVPKTGEHRTKLSIANLGKKHSPLTKTKISEARKGIKFTNSHKQKISNSMKGIKHPLYQINPWENPKTIKLGFLYNWYNLSKVYDIWVVNRCGSKKLCDTLTKIDKKMINSRKSFESMINWFKVHGNPNSNMKWIYFKNSLDF